MREFHPYGMFFPRGARGILIGSFPIGKFTNPDRRHEIGPQEVDFFFGGERNLLWKLLGDVWEEELRTREDIVRFLSSKGLAVGDVVRSCVRRRGGASDADLQEIEWNLELLSEIQNHGVTKIYFTSRKVEAWFRRLFPDTGELKTTTLISPSGQSIRSLHRVPGYEDWKKRHPSLRGYEFILERYKEIFREL